MSRDADSKRRTNGLDAESLQLVLDTVDQIRKQLLPKEKVLELDRLGTFPEQLIRKMIGPEIALQLLFLPEAYGGMGGGARDCCAVTQAMAGICLGIGTAFFALQLGADPILVAGTEPQKEEWLGKLARGESLVAYAVTEPGAGSNLAALKTKADPVLDENGTITGYTLNGTKQFISTGGYADFVTVLANAPEGATFFIVEKGDPGFVQGKGEEKHGIRASNTSPLSFTDVFVPVDRLVGGVPGRGLKQANEVFGYTRLMVGSMALGAAQAALRIVIPYAKTRVQFGTPLSEKQGYAHKLVVPHAVRLEAAAAYIDELARRFDAGEPDLEVEGSIAKYFTTEAANKAADDAMQALGGYGYIAEYEVEKIKRDLKITCIYEGTSEIQQNIISMLRWKKTWRSKGRFYTDLAVEMEELAARAPDTGAHLFAQAARAVNESILLAHEKRYTRQQFVMFCLADMITHLEVGCHFAAKAGGLKEAGHPDAVKTCAMSRVFAAETSLVAANLAARIAMGTGQMSPEEEVRFLERIGHGALTVGQRGVIGDMDLVASILFAD